MKASNELYKLVYDYFSVRIRFGYYANNDSLPSMPKICAHFRLAIPTVRAALAQLERDKYIRIEAARAAKVIYNAGPAKIKKNIAQYVLPREEGLRDVGMGGLLLIEPLWEAALQQWKNEDFDRLRQELMQPVSDTLFMPVELYIVVLSSLNNKLLLNLYWEMVRYICFPYLAEERNVQDIRQEIGGLTNDEVIASLKKEYIAEYEQATDRLFAFLKKARSEYPEIQKNPIPFEWNIYRNRPQLRYSLTASIIITVIRGKYPPGSYLPSLPQMAEQYGVAVSTIRRTLRILTYLGVVKSYHGKGTLVCMSEEKIDFTRPEIQSVLAIFLESLQFLSLTARAVSVFTLQAVSADALTQLVQQLLHSQDEKKSYLIIDIYLTFIIEHCTCAMVRECYCKVKELLACGYPITLQRLKEHGLDYEYSSAVTNAVNKLRDRNFDAFADMWSSFLHYQEQEIRNYIENNSEGSRGPL